MPVPSTSSDGFTRLRASGTAPAPSWVAVAFACLVAASSGACKGTEEAPSGSFGDVQRMLEESGARTEPIEWGAGEADGFAIPEDVFGEEGLEHLLQTNPDSAATPTAAEIVDSADAASAFSGNPYLLFGPRIIPHTDGTITKVYPLPPGKGKQLTDLMQVLEPFPVTVFETFESVPADAARDPGVVQVILLPEWDQELYQNLETHPPKPPEKVSIADWLVVTGTESRLWDVESFMRVFAAGVPQIELEATIVEITETDELDVGITPSIVDGATVPTITNTTNTDAVLFDSATLAFPNKADAAEAILALSTIQEGYVFSAIIEMVKNWENVQIKSQPKIAVREGGTASIENVADIPFYGFSGITATGGFNATLQIKEVGTKMFVVPRVVHDTVALDINIESSNQIGTLVSFVTESGGELATPIVARRKAKTVVYLRPGEAVMLGGLDQERTVEEESKVPILGDIPLIGYLFRSTYSRKETTRVMFIISPRVLQAAELDSEF